MKARIAAWALATAALVGGAAAQEARPVPWALSFTHGPLESHSLTYRDGTAETFYYFTFRLKNDSSQTAKLHLHVRAVVGSSLKKQKVHYATPAPFAEEAIRRLARASDLKNVQQINDLGTLEPGKSVRGIAVLGAFSREWDVATILVSGLEPFTRHARVRKYGAAGYTLPHRAYHQHNRAVREKAGAGASFTDVFAIVQHDVVWKMVYTRRGDEFAPQLDPIHLETERWDVVSTKIIMEKEPPFGGS